MEDHGCPKKQDLVDGEKYAFARVTLPETRPHFTVHRARGNVVRFLDNAAFNVVSFVMWNVLSPSTKLISLIRFNVFLRDSIMRNWANTTVDWWRRIYYNSFNCLWRQQSGEKPWACLGQTGSRYLNMFLTQLFVFFWIFLVAFREIILQETVTNPLFGREFCVVQQDTF